jgi:O-acetyl-ADP-ribose deacetylase (regulator of RNase III)
MPINYVIGDATRPQGEGLKVIVHCCNDVGAWGAGFVVALSRKWKRPEEAYLEWFEKSGAEKFKALLGAVQLVHVEPDIWVANLIGQVGLRRGLDGAIPVRYEAFTTGFTLLADHLLKTKNASIHAPRLGCGLAGGEWSSVEPLLEKHFVERGIPVTIYDLP